MRAKKCIHIINVKNKKRRCKRNAIMFGKCMQHNKNTINKDSNKQITDDYAVCCFCGEHCNPCSQSCGICARIISLH